MLSPNDANWNDSWTFKSLTLRSRGSLVLTELGSRIRHSRLSHLRLRSRPHSICHLYRTPISALQIDYLTTRAPPQPWVSCASYDQSQALGTLFRRPLAVLHFFLLCYLDILRSCKGSWGAESWPNLQSGVCSMGAYG